MKAKSSQPRLGLNSEDVFSPDHGSGGLDRTGRRVGSIDDRRIASPVDKRRLARGQDRIIAELRHRGVCPQVIRDSKKVIGITPGMFASQLADRG
jgi:hypothetical protein